DTVWIGGIHEQGIATGSTTFIQAITDINGGNEIGVNGYLGVLSNVTVVNGFNLGATGDVLEFAPGSWARGNINSGGIVRGLQTNDGLNVTAGHNASLGLISQPGTTPPAGDVTLDAIATYANAGALLAALKQGGV